MAIQVNQDICIGCGTCEQVCPDSFKMNEEGKSEAKSHEVLDCTKAASEQCPVSAIEISE